MHNADGGYTIGLNRPVWFRSLSLGPLPTERVHGQIKATAIARPEKYLSVDDHSWYQGRAFNEYFRPAKVDREVMTISPFSDSRGLSLNLMNFFRPLGDAGFDERSIRIVHWLHHEMIPLIGKQLAAIDGTLPELSWRLRQTLRCLLEGDGEKQIAARLNLSRDTIHKYVGALYRRFGVQTRAELLALWIARRYPLDAVGAWEELFDADANKPNR